MMLYVLGNLQAIAQEITYYDYTWEPCAKEGAYYYRQLTKMDSLYLANDYFKASGKLQMNGTYKDALAKIAHGTFTWYYESGNFKRTTDYIDGKRLNDTINVYRDTTSLILKEKYIYQLDTMIESFEYYPAGEPYYHEKYENGLTRVATTYYETGEVKRKDYFNRKGEWRNGMCYKKNGEDTTYYWRTIDPEINGLNPLLYPNFISKYIEYPEYAKNNGWDGKAVIAFVVEVDGSLSEVKVLSASHELFGQSAINAINATNKRWSPGVVEGKIGRIRLTLPIRFTLN